jgi:hypothetical protein
VFFKWAGHVVLGNRVRRERRIGVVRNKGVPSIGVDFARDRKIVGLLEGRNRLAIVVTVLAVDLAWGEAVAVEQYLGFDDQRRVNAAVLRRGCIDGFQC